MFDEIDFFQAVYGLDLYEGDEMMSNVVSIENMKKIIQAMKDQGKDGIIMSLNEFENFCADIEKIQKRLWRLEDKISKFPSLEEYLDD